MDNRKSDELSVQIQNFGSEFLLLRTTCDQLDLPVVGRAIFEHRFSFIRDVIATEKEICLKLNSEFRDADEDALRVFIDRMCSVSATAFKTEGVLLANDRVKEHPVRTFELPVWFSDDDDWQAIVSYTDCDRDSYIERLLACDLRVAMLGFLPGFVYLDGLPRRLQVPRKPSPDQLAEANSLAIGGRYAGTYSLPSPAGWNVIGRLAVLLLQTNKLPPVALQAGDRIQLRQIDRTEFQALSAQALTVVEYNG